MRRINLVSSLLVLSAVSCGLATLAPTAHAGDKLRFAGDPVVDLMTDKGLIKVEVYKSEVPKTSENFLDLVNRKFYNGLTFHRVEPGFVIQGGDPNGNGTGNFNDPATHRDRMIKLEKNPKLKHDSAGTLAMARTSDPDSASCQFYITLAPATFLDNPPGYAVFGHVVEGLDVVKKIGIGDHIKKATLEQ